MTLPLAGCRVVVTRFEPEGGPLATALARAGATPIVVPLIGIDRRGNDDGGIRYAVSDFDWIAFTSANAVRIFWAGLNGDERRAFVAHSRIAAVGPATARAIGDIGATAALVSPEFVAESLADALGDVNAKSILWPRAAGARSVLADTLRSRGATVTDPVMYDTVSLTVPERVRESILGADAITFTSPSAIRAFVTSFGTATHPRIVCIGPVTADAARAAGLDIAAIAVTFTLGGVVTALTQMLAAERSPRVEPAEPARA